MMDYLYDGTFEGLLTCLYYNFAKIKATGIYRTDTYQTSLVNPHVAITTKEQLADKMYEKIRKHLGTYTLTDLYYCFLSEKDGFENILLSFIDLCFRNGPVYAGYHTHKEVIPFDDIVGKVKREVQRYVGYVRFKAVGDVLYSEINPEFFILPMLASHFADRYFNEKIIIHDAGRSLALISKDGKHFIMPYTETDLPGSEKEDHITNLWKEYFQHIAIEGRINLKLQRNFVPLKYRKDLVEFSKPK
ncbi:MAG: DNA metabolism protein [Eubacteriaceae bacterium]|nr:DNA metabolism protein [Eubacteriaceae bacterium]